MVLQQREGDSKLFMGTYDFSVQGMGAAAPKYTFPAHSAGLPQGAHGSMLVIMHNNLVCSDFSVAVLGPT